MLLTEAVDNLAYRLGKSEDEPFKERLKRDISVARAEILRREINKRSQIPSSYAHSLHSLETVEDKLAYQNPILSRKKVWRSEIQLPKPIMYHDQNPGFIFVGSLDSGTAHQCVAPERLTHRTTRFKDSQYYTFVDGYIMFFDNIKCFDVRAIFSDLLAVGTIKNKDGKLCVPILTIPDDIFTGVKRLLLEEENELSLSYKNEVEVNVDKP